MRILVIEDEKKIAGFLVKGLGEAGYAVDSAPSYEEAEEFLSSSPYDLVVLDVMLPGLNGFDAASRIRKDGIDTPILFLSALSETKSKVRGLDAGGDDYLTKPFSFDELLARVRVLLKRKGSSGVASSLEYADLKMDLLKRLVRRGDRPITLTPKEFSLLEYFLRNPERPIRRTELGEHVWDIRFDPGSNVIDVYINNLRKKLDDGTGKKLIQTVIGVGYALQRQAGP